MHVLRPRNLSDAGSNDVCVRHVAAVLYSSSAPTGPPFPGHPIAGPPTAPTSPGESCPGPLELAKHHQIHFRSKQLAAHQAAN